MTRRQPASRLFYKVNADKVPLLALIGEDKIIRNSFISLAMGGKMRERSVFYVKF